MSKASRTARNGVDHSGFERACSMINLDRLVRNLIRLVDVPSPTGQERPLAQTIVALLDELGLHGNEQRMVGEQSNAIGVLRGKHSSDGPKLLLYSPVDTVTSSDAREDLPWAGPDLRPEMLANGACRDAHVFGLGAHNPKGHAACILEAGAALRACGAELDGDLLLGFGAGGMPTNAREGMHKDSGHGAGCRHLLTEGPRPSCAVIAKSGWSVSWEEVGLIWFEVSVAGRHNYVGNRHLMPWHNPVTDAARLITMLDKWLAQWPDMHRSGLVAPQGAVSFVQSGWERMPAFTPALTRFRIDLRLSPRTTPDLAEQMFRDVLKSCSRDLGITTVCQRIVAIPGTCTDPDEPVIRKAIESWEAVEGAAHRPATGMSGATDANILRAFEIPTARVGMPKAELPNLDFQLGMNAVSVEDLLRLTRFLVHVTLNICNHRHGGTSGG